MTNRIGKIGRLPKTIRHQLGLRIEDSEPGNQLVAWLNDQPEVHAILNTHFDGRAITEQNLSDWKQSGHLDWLRREEARQATANLVEHSDDLEAAAQDHNLSDRFATVLAAEMSRLAAQLLEAETDPEKRWQRLCEINRELSQLRRDDHRAVQIAIKQEQWQREQAQAAEAELKQMKQEAKDRHVGMIFSELDHRANAQSFGGGELGHRMAELLHRVRFDLPLDDLVAAKTAAKSKKSRLVEADRGQVNSCNPSQKSGGVHL